MAGDGLLVGSARVAIIPDLRGFGDQLKAKIQAEAKAAGGNITVPIKFDVDQASAAAARAALGPLAGGARTIPVKFAVDPKSAAAARAALGPLAGQTVPIKAEVDPSSIAKANAEIRAGLAGAADGAGSATAQLDKLTAAERNAAAGATAAAAAFNRVSAVDRDYSASMIGTIAAVNEASGAEGRLFAVSQTGTAALIGLTDATRGNAAAAVQQALATKASSDAMAAAIPLYTSGGGRFGFLTGSVQLFGGALTKIGVPAILATASGLHILIDGILTTGATLLPAAIAFGAFGAAAIPTVQDITKHMQNLNTINTALGTSIYPLTGGFSKLADAVKPQVYQLFGEALTLINSKTGVFTQLATGAGKVLNDLGARFVAAATSGNGLGGFLKNGVTDLAKWGNVIGNIGGIFANFFKALPGYAGILLNLLGGFTHIAEVATGAVTPILAVGLAFHGFLLYAGLAVTALVALRGPMVALGTWALQGVAGLAGLGVAFAATVAEEDIFVATTSLLSRVSPFAWVVLAVGALAGLAAVLITSKDAAQQFNDSIQKTIQNASLLSLQATIQAAAVQTTTRLATSTRDLSDALKTNTTVFAGRAGTINSNGAAISSAATKQDQYKQGLDAINSTSQLVNGRVAALSKQYGGQTAAMALLNEAGITTAQITNKNSSAWAAAQVEIAATNNAYAAMAVGAGRAGAANNALGNSFMTETLPAMQKVTQAEDTLINTMIGGEQSFTTFQQAMQQMAVDAGVSTGYLKINNSTLRITGQSAIIGAKAMDGLNAASLKLSGDFYSSVVPAAQKTIDALQQQQVSTKNLTTAVATEAGQMLSLAGKNDAAKATIVALINNALGPGTVSMKTLNSWVTTNATSMQGFKAIVDKATIAAGTLANVLNSDLNAIFAQTLLRTTGADKAMATYTKDLANNRQNTAAGRADRAQLIKDLQNSGYSADAAKKLVDGYTTSLHKVPSQVNTAIHVTGTGTWSISASKNTNYGSGLFAGTSFAGAGGGIVPGYAPGQDTRLAAVSPGEAILVPELTRALGPANIIAANKLFGNGRKSTGLKFAGGGLVAGNSAGLGPWTDTQYNNTVNADDKSVADAMRSAINAQVKAALAAASGGFMGDSGVRSGSAALAQAFARSIMGQYGWGAGQWPPWQYLGNQESGWSAYAVNKSSGAYGIGQSLGHGHPYALGDYQNQVIWMANYIRGRYGSPSVAWAHERAFNWYDQGIDGQWAPPGASLLLNGTGAPEAVVRPDQIAAIASSGGGGGTEYHAHFDGWTQGMVISQVRQAFTAMSVADGRRLRMGRRS